MLESFYNNLIVDDRYRMILDGLQVTLVITVCAVILYMFYLSQTGLSLSVQR